MTIDKQAVQAVADLKAGYTLGHADVEIIQQMALDAVTLLDELDKYQQYAKERDAENESLALTVGRLRVDKEAAEKTSAARLEAIDTTHKMFQRERDRAEDAEKRIAELEAKQGSPVMFIDGDISPADADKLAAVIREFNEETETPAARMARIIRENPHPTNECDMPSAGIKGSE